jgi:hypothetical protein
VGTRGIDGPIEVRSSDRQLERKFIGPSRATDWFHPAADSLVQFRLIGGAQSSRARPGEYITIMKGILSGVLTCEERRGAENGRREHCR